jgi:hypothetical protein
MEAMSVYEISVEFQQTPGRYNQNNRNLHNHRCMNLKTYKKE